MLTLLLLADLPLMLGRKCGGAKCKVNEVSSRPVDFPRLCDDRIIKYYNMICKTLVDVKRRRRRGVT